MECNKRQTILVLTDRIGANLANGSQVFVNAILVQLTKWFDLIVVVANAVQPSAKLKQSLIIVTENREPFPDWLVRRVDLNAIKLIYNLGATSFSCRIAEAVCRLLPGVPLVNHFQVLLREYARHEGWSDEQAKELGSVQEMLARRAVRNIFPSFAELKLTFSWGWEAEYGTTHVVPNAFVPTGKIEQIPKRKQPTFLAAGRFSDYVKGADLLYSAFLHLLKTNSSARLEIAGDDRRFTELLRTIPRDSWAFLGWIPRAKLNAVMKSVDAVVVPSRYEPFGLVAIEAMAMGTPVIAMAVGGLAEIIHHEHTGWLCPPEEGSLGLGLAMASAACNRKRARAMGLNAKRIVDQEYSLGRIAGIVRTHLSNALSRDGFENFQESLVCTKE